MCQYTFTFTQNKRHTREYQETFRIREEGLGWLPLALSAGRSALVVPLSSGLRVVGVDKNPVAAALALASGHLAVVAFEVCEAVLGEGALVVVVVGADARCLAWVLPEPLVAVCSSEATRGLVCGQDVLVAVDDLAIGGVGAARVGLVLADGLGAVADAVNAGLALRERRACDTTAVRRDDNRARAPGCALVAGLGALAPRAERANLAVTEEREATCGQSTAVGAVWAREAGGLSGTRLVLAGCAAMAKVLAGQVLVLATRAVVAEVLGFLVLVLASATVVAG